jgi:hypothetical protein
LPSKWEWERGWELEADGIPDDGGDGRDGQIGPDGKQGAGDDDNDGLSDDMG